MSIPRIQIQQKPALLGIDAELGEQHIRQPRASFTIRTDRPEQEIQAKQGVLKIDQSKAFDAVCQGPFLNTMNRIYSQANHIALQGVSKIVADGNRMAQISLPGNAFAEIAKRDAFQSKPLHIRGPASVLNVNIDYEPGQLDMRVSGGGFQLFTQPSPPEYDYSLGKLDIYVLRRQQVEIIPPRLDYHV